MPSKDIDDLFRAQLAGHETPPGEALWARLNAAPTNEPATDLTAERLDQLFHKGLNAHATPPGRELWERLEDEHLRPRSRRAAAWWPMAMAAAMALLLVAGGAGLWLGFPWSDTPNVAVASHIKRTGKPALETRLPQTNASGSGISAEISTAESPATAAVDASDETRRRVTIHTNAKNLTVQATRSGVLASTAPKASMAASGQLLRHPWGTTRQPDADAEHPPLVARTTTRTANRPAPGHPTAADEPRPATAPVVAVTPETAPAPEIVPAVPTTPTVASLASTGELITVDVRNGGNPASRPAKTTSTALAAAEEPEGRRGLGGRLLRQAGHLVRGERVSLAEVTGLPENLTLRATVAGRSVSKSIQL